MLTAPEEGLWDSTPYVSPEDIRHMQNRVEIFKCFKKVDKDDQKTTEACAIHMCKWIAQGAAEADAAPLRTPVLPIAASGSGPTAASDAKSAILGFQELASRALLPEEAAASLESALVQLGARDVREASREDWEGLSAFQVLKPFEMRRLLKAIE